MKGITDLFFNLNSGLHLYYTKVILLFEVEATGHVNFNSLISF